MPGKKISETAPAAEVEAEKRSVAKKAPAKKSSTRKTVSKAATAVTAPKETVKVQFGGEEYDFSEIKKAVEADYKGKITAVDIYIKPEDKAVYYVVNSDYSGKIEL